VIGRCLLLVYHSFLADHYHCTAALDLLINALLARPCHADVCVVASYLFVLPETASRIDCTREYEKLGRDCLVANNLARLVQYYHHQQPQRQKQLNTTNSPQLSQLPPTRIYCHANREAYIKIKVLGLTLSSKCSVG